MCLKCKVEEREIDCLCCQELAALNEKLDVEKNATCITEAEEFKILCLNKVMLQNVLVGLHDAREIILRKKRRTDRIALLAISNLRSGFIRVLVKEIEE